MTAHIMLTTQAMPYHRHAPLRDVTWKDGLVVRLSSALLSRQGNAERSLREQERVETGRGAARLLMQGAKAQSDHQGNLGSVMRQSKEWVNILFAGTRWGVTKKAPKSFSAEHIFVNPLLDPDVIGEAVYQELTKPDPDDARKRKPLFPDFLFLTKFDADSAAAGGPLFTMVTAPDDVETFIGHVSGPQGPRSNLTRVEVVQGATIHYEAMILRDEIKHHHWPVLFLAGQENGLGAMRSQGYGRFDVTRFERTSGKFPPLNWDEALAAVDKDAILRDYQRAKEKLIEDGELVGEETSTLIPLAEANSTARAKKAPKNGKVAALTV